MPPHNSQPTRGAGDSTRLGLAAVCVWHAADHYGQMIIYLRLNGIVPPASRPNPPPLSNKKGEGRISGEGKKVMK